jgi:acyl-coenzyme A synthetase/AMP-(fatty) acid ligase
MKSAMYCTVAENVPSYMQLRGGVEFRDVIPKSHSGKILRRLLRDELKEKTTSKL